MHIYICIYIYICLKISPCLSPKAGSRKKRMGRIIKTHKMDKEHKMPKEHMCLMPSRTWVPPLGSAEIGLPHVGPCGSKTRTSRCVRVRCTGVGSKVLGEKKCWPKFDFEHGIVLYQLWVCVILIATQTVAKRAVETPSWGHLGMSLISLTNKLEKLPPDMSRFTDGILTHNELYNPPIGVSPPVKHFHWVFGR